MLKFVQVDEIETVIILFVYLEREQKTPITRQKHENMGQKLFLHAAEMYKATWSILSLLYTEISIITTIKLCKCFHFSFRLFWDL